jgi:hypothetical protein
MFYEQNQVENLLNCQICNQRYDKPYLLPCCKTICSRCLIKLLNNQSSSQKQSTNSKIIKCPYCSIDHQLQTANYMAKSKPVGDSLDGLRLPLNETIQELLNMKPVDVQRADLCRTMSEILKTIGEKLEQMDKLESNTQQTLLDYFELIKKELNQSTNCLIDQINKQRENMIQEIEYIKAKSIENMKENFCKTNKLNELKRLSKKKKNEWKQLMKNEKNFKNEQITSNFLSETKSILDEVNELKELIDDVVQPKLAWNQRQRTSYSHACSALLGQLEFNSSQTTNHRLKIKHLNRLLKLNKYELSNEHLKKSVYLAPLLFKRLLNVTKSTFDDVADLALTIIDVQSSRIINENKTENKNCKLIALRIHLNHIAICTTKNDEESNETRHLLKLYDSSLNLVSSVYSEYQPSELFMNDEFLYAQIESNTHPFVLKYDYNLKRCTMFEKLKSDTELFVTLIVDKLVYISSKKKLYFVDSCFSRLKVYDESNGTLLQSINLDNLRDACVCVDYLRLEQTGIEQFIYVNRIDKKIKLYNERGELIAENKLDEQIKCISEFHLSPDGSYIFLDHLNDSIYYY